MLSYHTHRTRLQHAIFTTFTPVALVKLLNLRVQSLRCGGGVYGNVSYGMHELLTAEQKKALKHKLTQHILETIFTDDFISMLLKATFEPSGKPRKESKLLYHWLLRDVYSSDLTHMIADWLTVVRQCNVASATKASS